jgi:hypothetical protein
MTKRITLRTLGALLVALFAVLCLVGPVLGLAGCTEQPMPDVPAVPTVLVVAEEAVAEARQHLDDVAKVLEQAEQALESATKLHDALVQFRTAYDAERYSEACAHLRKAIAEAEVAGFQVPSEVATRVGQAKLLLELAGR